MTFRRAIALLNLKNQRHDVCPCVNTRFFDVGILVFCCCAVQFSYGLVDCLKYCFEDIFYVLTCISVLQNKFLYACNMCKGLFGNFRL